MTAVLRAAGKRPTTGARETWVPAPDLALERLPPTLLPGPRSASASSWQEESSFSTCLENTGVTELQEASLLHSSNPQRVACVQATMHWKCWEALWHKEGQTLEFHNSLSRGPLGWGSSMGSQDSLAPQNGTLWLPGMTLTPRGISPQTRAGAEVTLTSLHKGSPSQWNTMTKGCAMRSHTPQAAQSPPGCPLSPGCPPSPRLCCPQV